MKKLTKINLLSSIADVFKEGQKQKKWSAKRSISGVLCAAVISDISINGISWENVLLAFISVLPLCFSVFKNESCTNSSCRR